jgi:hypothetical protein
MAYKIRDIGHIMGEICGFKSFVKWMTEESGTAFSFKRFNSEGTEISVSSICSCVVQC